jgi:hypothetical protein
MAFDVFNNTSNGNKSTGNGSKVDGVSLGFEDQCYLRATWACMESSCVTLPRPEAGREIKGL